MKRQEYTRATFKIREKGVFLIGSLLEREKRETAELLEQVRKWLGSASSSESDSEPKQESGNCDDAKSLPPAKTATDEKLDKNQDNGSVSRLLSLTNLIKNTSIQLWGKRSKTRWPIL